MPSNLPRLVLSLTHNHDAWIIGGAANPDNETPRDYDIIVPFYEWGPASSLIPPNATPNSFGGWKCISDGIEVDVWPGDLGWIMQRPKCVWTWHPKTGIRIKQQ
jgi:hypothetical protein